MELLRFAGITPARVQASGARGSAIAKETCWESGNRCGLDDNQGPGEGAWRASELLHVFRSSLSGAAPGQGLRGSLPERCPVRCGKLAQMMKTLGACAVCNRGAAALEEPGAGGP